MAKFYTIDLAGPSPNFPFDYMYYYAIDLTGPWDMSRQIYRIGLAKSVNHKSRPPSKFYTIILAGPSPNFPFDYVYYYPIDLTGPSDMTGQIYRIEPAKSMDPCPWSSQIYSIVTAKVHTIDLAGP